MIFSLDSLAHAKVQAFCNYTTKKFNLTNYKLAKLLIHTFILVIVISVVFSEGFTDLLSETIVYLAFFVGLMIYLVLLEEVCCDEMTFMQNGRLQKSWFLPLRKQKMRISLVAVYAITLVAGILMSEGHWLIDVSTFVLAVLFT